MHDTVSTAILISDLPCRHVTYKTLLCDTALWAVLQAQVWSWKETLCHMSATFVLYMTFLARAFSRETFWAVLQAQQAIWQ